MKDAGGIYRGRNERGYLAVYNFNTDIFRMLPPGFGAESVAHFSYCFGRRKGSVDVFRLLPGAQPESIAKIVTGVKILGRNYQITKDSERKKRIWGVYRKNLQNVREKQNIHVQILGTLPEEIRDEIMDLTNTDIFEFCEGVAAKTREAPRTTLVDKIVPETKIRRITPDVILTTGKQEFVPECLLQANIDFGQGCMTSWIPGENARFDGKTFTNFFLYTWGECYYCYSRRNHRTFPKTLYEFDKNRLLEELRGAFVIQKRTVVEGKETVAEKRLGRPVRILRFGKRTESFTPYTRDYFVQTLEACIETGTKAVITSKLLPYDKEISGLVKRTNSTLLFSQCNDRFQRGAVMHGFTNAAIMETAIKYREDNVNTLIYLNVPNPLHLTDDEWAKIAEARRHKLEVQVLPLKYKRSDVMKEMTGIRRRIATGQPHLFDPSGGTYFMEGNQAIPKFNSMDPKLIETIGDNNRAVSMCHHDDQQTFCAGCGIAPGRMGKREKVTKRKFQKTRKTSKRKYWEPGVKLNPSDYW